MTADADKFPFRTTPSSFGFNVCTETINAAKQSFYQYR